jgi:hypothetical protein
VEACVRFYRDQCLHGLVVPDPGAPTVDKCVQTIEQAGTCAAAKGEMAATSSCMPPPSLSTSAATACQLIGLPESAAECAFLTPVPLPDAGVDAEGTPDASTDASDGAAE